MPITVNPGFGTDDAFNGFHPEGASSTDDDDFRTRQSTVRKNTSTTVFQEELYDDLESTTEPALLGQGSHDGYYDDLVDALPGNTAAAQAFSNPQYLNITGDGDARGCRRFASGET
jgi:hypothetical protein